MGRSSNTIPEAMISVISDEIRDERVKRKLYRTLIEACEMEDYDCLCELFDMDEVFEETYKELNPELDYDDWEDEETLSMDEIEHSDEEYDHIDRFH